MTDALLFISDGVCLSQRRLVAARFVTQAQQCNDTYTFCHQPDGDNSCSHGTF